MWTFAPLGQFISGRLDKSHQQAIENVASKVWEIAPAEEGRVPAAFALPAQFDRVTGWTFSSDDPRREMVGGHGGQHGATRAFLLKDAILFDGRLFKGRYCHHLHPRSTNAIVANISTEIDRGAIYSTFTGNKYFGMWLADDCLTYPLAQQEGVPVTTAQKPWPHVVQYEALLDMKPQPHKAAYIRQAVLFDDRGHNKNKLMRARAIRQALLSKVTYATHPCVFIIRGLSGERRALVNEQELADRMQKTRGFQIVDPTKLSASEIISRCAGAQTLMGVEGSGLFHGLAVLREGGRVLTLQPPNRFVTMIKHLTDRNEQHFGYVVGLPRGADFWIDPDEVERTLDLFPDDR
jgi:hypothetical protein